MINNIKPKMFKRRTKDRERIYVRNTIIDNSEYDKKKEEVFNHIHELFDNVDIDNKNAEE
jgi:hypothetical protein